MLLQNYLSDLNGVIKTACTIYGLDKLYLGGGIVAATEEAGFSLKDALHTSIKSWPNYIQKPQIEMIKIGNLAQLEGVAKLAWGEHKAASVKYCTPFSSLTTEKSMNSNMHLETKTAEELTDIFLNAEAEAVEKLSQSSSLIAKVAVKLSKCINKGGRLIYVGCGTSGRVAAMDAVELNCTYGLEKDKSLALISGGSAEAIVSIEEDFEEDASAVPDMIALNISPDDMVIGISASGSAYYVRSALAFAKACGAVSSLISESVQKDTEFYDFNITMNSGPEVVTGSTRMKAGTATKKILNTLSSTAMILNGKVYGTYMIDVACLNDKLIARAESILESMFSLDSEESVQLLKNNDFNLKHVIDKLNSA